MKPSEYFIPLCLLLVCIGQLRSQNLVPNGSFEEYTECPNESGQIERAAGWYYLFPTSPDFFHSCAPNGNHVAVPQSALGFQYPATGNGYGGVATYWGSTAPPNYPKEVMAIPLLNTLAIGVPVHLSFRTAVGGDGNVSGSLCRLSVQGVGMRFRTTITSDLMIGPANEAAVWLQTVQTDTAAWTTVSGWYTPDSAYTYLQIGNFFADSLLTPVTIFPNGDVDIAYAFIDDVCVSYDSIPCDFTQAIETIPSEAFGVFPNPSFGDAFIHLPASSGGPWEGVVADASGRLVRSVAIPAGETPARLPLADLPTGIYYLTLKTTVMARRTIKLVYMNP